MLQALREYSLPDGATERMWQNISDPAEPPQEPGGGSGNSGLPATFGGAVKFVSDTVDCGNLSSSNVNIVGGTANAPIGESPFGVWGALGSKDGGESKAL